MMDELPRPGRPGRLAPREAREVARAGLGPRSRWVLHLDLGLIPGFGLASGFGLGLGLSFHPRGVFAAGLPFGLLCLDTLRGLICPCKQFVQPRLPVISRGLILRAGLRNRPGIRPGRE